MFLTVDYKCHVYVRVQLHYDKTNYVNEAFQAFLLVIMTKQ